MKILKPFLFSIYIILFTISNAYPQESVSLEGKWRVALDVWNRGTADKWFEMGLPGESDNRLSVEIFYKGRRREHAAGIQWFQAPFTPFAAQGDFGKQPEEMYLPGTDNDGQLGKPLVYSPTLSWGLERLYAYDGIMWLEKEITIPEQWIGKSVQLFFERVPGISKVWLDGVPKGGCQAFAVPHIYEIFPSAVPGKYKLTVMINNNVEMEGWGSHHIIPASGARWNGIIGKIELQAKNRVTIQSVQVYPDIHRKKAIVKLLVKNGKNERLEGDVVLSVHRKGEPHAGVSQQQIKCSLTDDSIQLVHAEISIPEPVALWDEFNPALYELVAELKMDGQSSEQETVTFGMRELTTRNGQFLLNGQPVFLRGSLECGQFPHKADPAMDKETWLHILNVYRQYGLNHLRFHTWCPPKAAFQAGDELGFIFLVETVGPPYAELSEIFNAYGNHPSFGLLSLHNEQNHNDATRQAITKGKNIDPRRLYSCTTHPYAPDCIDDFFVSAWGNDLKMTVGIQWGGGDVVSATRFNTHHPETASDYRNEINGVNVPMISHEMGQWAVYPDLSEIPKYNGVLRNTNYERIKEDLWKKGMIGQASDFTKASGMLSLLLYKEEIEATLRTPLYGGFQLLDIHDFQRQISTVGIINAFWESKGLITAEGFREFCSPSVPLFRMEKRVWTLNETIEGIAELSYFGPVTKKVLQPVWRIYDNWGNVLMSGKLEKQQLDSRGLFPLGKIQASLNKMHAPAKLQLVIEIPEIKAVNRWNFWVYPARIDTFEFSDIQIFNGWGNDVKEALSLGKKVLLFPKTDDLHGSRVGCFTTIFWNSWQKWPQLSHTMGILCEPSHPVFEDFPTDSHSDWQWWYLIMNTRVMLLDKLPLQMKPLVQVVDNCITNRKLGYLFECKVGEGKLMVCSMDIMSDLTNRPVAGQFRKSLLQYMNGNKFNPEYEVDFDSIRSLFE